MIELTQYSTEAQFTPSPRHIEPSGNELLLLFGNRQRIYGKAEENRLEVPTLQEFPEYKDKTIYCGTLDGTECYAAWVNEEQQPAGLTAIDLREVLQWLTPGVYTAVARGEELSIWLEKQRFCGGCGGKMAYAQHDMSRVCPQCQKIYYPFIAPAIIVAITKGDQLLLAANKNFRPGLHSLIAGFVESGESLEAAVKREVMEEVGLEVHNIKYFGSQTWPFPASLMVGFTAEYLSGELKPDGHEIIAADWYRSDKLPMLPSYGSIARRIIDSIIGGGK